MLGGIDEDAAAGYRATTWVRANQVQLFDVCLRQGGFEAGAQFIPFRPEISGVEITFNELGIPVASDRLVEQHFEDILFNITEGMHDEHRDAVRRLGGGLPVETILVDRRGKLDKLIQL